MFIARHTAVCLSLALALAPARVEAAPAEAEVHYEEAARLYAEQDYEGAAREFAIAYALDPRVETMFAWAQAERLAEHYDEAAKLYRRLLDGELSNKQRDAVEGLLAEVEALRAEQPEPPDADEDQGDEDDDDEDPTPVEPSTKPSGLGARISVGVGAGALAVGAGLLVGGLVSDARVRNATTYAEFDQRYDPTTGRGRGAVPLYVSGGVVLGLGLVAVIVGAVALGKRDRAEASLGARRGPRLVVARGIGLAW